MESKDLKTIWSGWTRKGFIVKHRTNVNMYIKYIQGRVHHYRIATTQELVKMNVTQDDKCSFCGEVETLEQLVYKYLKSDFLAGYTNMDKKH